MELIIIVSMILSLLIALFAVQNAGFVTINLLWFKLTMSQAVVIIGSCLLGVVIMTPFCFIRTIKQRLKIKELNHQIKILNDKLEEQVQMSNTNNNKDCCDIEKSIHSKLEETEENNFDR